MFNCTYYLPNLSTTLAPLRALLAKDCTTWFWENRQLELKAQWCEVCWLHRAAPATAPLHPWEWPVRRWSHLHINHAEPFMGHLFLIVINACSKWMEVYPTSIISATDAKELLWLVFATHGLPDMVVSDNGTRFTGEKFDQSWMEFYMWKLENWIPFF